MKVFLFGLLLHTKIESSPCCRLPSQARKSPRLLESKPSKETRPFARRRKKWGRKVKREEERYASRFLFISPRDGKLCSPNLSFVLKGERYLGPICLDKRERERDSTLASFLSVSAKAPQSLDSLLRGARTVVKNRFIGGTLFVRAVSLVERGRKKRVCVCFPGLSLLQRSTTATLFSSFFS